ncbi:unnamed protein product [Toxocara canis]|uniref:Glycine-rich protein n=1 Tax=Toxocara canis TaxID=6265 RepID=A0A183UPL4_TOXCA|nr:unnamed protein product [Toxocara canis]
MASKKYDTEWELWLYEMYLSKTFNDASIIASNTFPPHYRVMFAATVFTCVVFAALAQASVLPVWGKPWGAFWGSPLFDGWGFGHGAEVGHNVGRGDDFTTSSAHGLKSDWGNYNYGGHGHYAKGIAYGTGAADGSANAYENGWGDGWGLGGYGFHLPWARNGYPIFNPWWLH